MTRHSFLKGLSFEMLSNVIGLGLAYLMFGNFCGCVTFTIACFALKTGLFVLHEKVWEG